MNDASALLALAAALARDAGGVLLEHAGRVAQLRTATKSSATDPVSEADHAAERRIRDRLRAERPDDAILGEEGGETPGSTGLRWVVDPLDGTVNFLYGIPQWSVSVAVQDPGGTLAGVVYDPLRDELWSASADDVARRNGEPVQASTCASLGSALVATGFGYDADVRAAQGEVVRELLPRVRDIRRIGSAALDLAWTAAGRYDAFFERGVQAWDVAAGELLCRRAGLRVHRLEPAPPAAGGLLVGPAPLVDALVPIVA